MFPSDVVCRTRGVHGSSSLLPPSASGEPTKTEDGSRSAESPHVEDASNKSSPFLPNVSVREDIAAVL